MPEDLHIITIAGEDIVVQKTDKGFQTRFTEPEGWFLSHHRHVFPKKARVYLQESEENWGGRSGVSNLIYTDPPCTVVFRRFDQPDRVSDERFLLGKRHIIYPDGSYTPPELLDTIQFAEAIMGYKIDQAVLAALGIEDAVLKEMFGEQR